MNHHTHSRLVPMTFSRRLPSLGRVLSVASLAGASLLLAACDRPAAVAAVPTPPAQLQPGTTQVTNPDGSTTTTTVTVVNTPPVSASTAPVARAVAAPRSHTVAVNSTEVRTAPAVADPAAVGQLGRISAVEAVKSDPKPTNGVGAVVGGVIGGVLGHQVGGGSGKDAATVVGAVGGAIAGNNVQKNTDREVVGYRLRITLDNGQAQEVIVPSRGDWAVGERVRVAKGHVYPV